MDYIEITLSDGLRETSCYLQKPENTEQGSEEMNSIIAYAMKSFFLQTGKYPKYAEMEGTKYNYKEYKDRVEALLYEDEDY